MFFGSYFSEVAVTFLVLPLTHLNHTKNAIRTIILKLVYASEPPGSFLKTQMPRPQSRPIKLKCPGGEVQACLFLKISIANSGAQPKRKIIRLDIALPIIKWKQIKRKEKRFLKVYKKNFKILLFMKGSEKEITNTAMLFSNYVQNNCLPYLTIESKFYFFIFKSYRLR